MKKRKKHFGLKESILLDVLVAINEAKAQGDFSFDFEKNLAKALRANGDLRIKAHLSKRGYQIVKNSIPRFARKVVKEFFLRTGA